MPKTKQPGYERKERAIDRMLMDPEVATPHQFKNRRRIIEGDPKPPPKPPLPTQKTPADRMRYDRKSGSMVETMVAEIRRDYHKKHS